MRLLKGFALAALAAVLWACSPASDERGDPGDVGSAESDSSNGAETAAAGASVSFDVVGVRPGAKHDELNARLRAEGWDLHSATSNLVEAPGVAGYTAPDREIWYRAVQDAGQWRSETVAINFAPTLPDRPAEAYLIMFNRVLTAGPTTIESRGRERIEITQDYAIQTLAAVKSKYGEPRETGEGACETYGGTEPRRSIPIYELTYDGMVVKIGETCGQTMDIRIEDAALRRARYDEFEAFRAAQVQRATSEPSAAPDF